MKLGLGIDTGGTYTDSVIYDFSENKVMAQAKALTTKDDLSKGIIGSLKNLPKDMVKRVELVSLSTTLATNACVEGKDGRGCLVLLGYDRELYQRLKGSYGLPDISEIIMLDGGHDQQGRALSEPDWTCLEQALDNTSKSTDAYGIVEYWGIRNSRFEQRAKELVRKRTDKPVVCAHELSDEINSLRRAATTLLNANLINMTDALLKAVNTGLAQLGVKAPVMVVKGDGTLMSESFSLEHPVETLLSGPASSVIGGMKLTDNDAALILDIGGTTSDLAAVRDKMTVLSSKGVDVGSWRTGTKAIKLKTIGLGGDSLISFDQNEELTIGPKRALPLSYLAKKYINVKDELEKIEYEDKWHSLSLGEFYYLNSKPDKSYVLSDLEKSAIKALENGPLSKKQLAETLDVSAFLLSLETLEKPGFIVISALTPSDIMHISGDYKAWDKESAVLGGRILANRLNISLDELVEKINDKIVQRLYKLVIEFLLSRNTDIYATLSPDALHLIEMAFKNPSDELQLDLTSHLPIIGIGAPAHIYINRLAKELNTKGIIPDCAEVANALGAVTGSIASEVTVVIKPRYDRTGIIGYGCHTAGDYFETEDYNEALDWAKQIATKAAEEQVHAMGGVNISTNVIVQEQKFEDARIELHMETDIVARSIGSQQIYSIAKQDSKQ